MPQVRDILEQKGTQVLTIGKEATVLQAALMMNEYKVGSLVVMEAGRIIDSGPARKLFDESRHPTTRRLVEAVPVLCTAEEDAACITLIR